MSLKVMCAGCSKDEREQAESDVRQAIGTRANGSETWIVSVVKVQDRWSVTLDGPAIRALTCTAPPGHLGQAIREALDAKTGAAARPAPAAPRAPSASAAPAPPSPAAPGAANAGPAHAARSAPPSSAPPSTPPPSTRPSSAAPARAAGPAAPAGASPPASPRPTPAPASPRPTAAPAPAAARPAADGSHACESCAQRFSVVYDRVPGEEQAMAPVACPHCWHLNRVPVGENAASDGDYRAEKA